MAPYLLLTAAAAAAAAAAGADPTWRPPFGLAAGQTFAGHYTCGSTAWLFLTIESVTPESVDAIFHFLYPGSTQSGVFEVHGTFVHGRVLKLVSVRPACRWRGPGSRLQPSNPNKPAKPCWALLPHYLPARTAHTHCLRFRGSGSGRRPSA